MQEVINGRDNRTSPSGDDRQARSVAPAYEVKSNSPDHGVNLREPYEVKTTATCSNAQSKDSIIYVNGMNMDPKEIHHSAVSLGHEYGCPIKVIPNNTKDFRTDLKNCVAGAVGRRMGAIAEPEAFKNLKNEILFRFANDINPIQIIGYSQGTIIINNVLENIKGDLNPEDWNALKKRIDLRTFGAAAKVFPEGIRVTGHQHKEDPVPGAVASATTIIFGLKQVLKGESLNLTRTTKISHEDKENKLFLPTFGAHGADVYAKNIPRFILQGISSLSIERQAGALMYSIRKGEYSDEIYNACVVELGNMALGKDYNQAMRAIALSRYISRESTIGEFRFGEEAKEILKLLSAIDEAKVPKPKFRLAGFLGDRQ